MGPLIPKVEFWRLAFGASLSRQRPVPSSQVCCEPLPPIPTTPYLDLQGQDSTPLGCRAESDTARRGQQRFGHRHRCSPDSRHRATSIPKASTPGPRVGLLARYAIRRDPARINRSTSSPRTLLLPDPPRTTVGRSAFLFRGLPARIDNCNPRSSGAIGRIASTWRSRFRHSLADAASHRTPYFL